MFFVEWATILFVGSILAILSRWSPRIRRMVFRSFAFISVIFLVLWFASFRYGFGYFGKNFLFMYAQGGIGAYRFPGIPESSMGWFGQRNTRDDIGIVWLIEVEGPIGVIGGWIPVVSFGIPALICLPPRRVKPGFCIKCQYNLTGNRSGICPECGTAIKSSSGSDISVS